MSMVRYRRIETNESGQTFDPVGLDRAKKVLRATVLFLFFTNLIFGIFWYQKSTTVYCRAPLVYSPFQGSITYEKRRLFRDIVHNVFTGPPRAEHDQAWRKLIEPMTIKITGEELQKINETSIELKDGTGFLAEMAVYHELHCLKRIRRHLYLDYYYPNMTEDERLREGPHIDHCLEYLREASMCRGDTTLATFQWANGKPFSHVHSDHECVVWEHLDSLVREIMVEMSDYAILVPPEL